MQPILYLPQVVQSVPLSPFSVASSVFVGLIKPPWQTLMQRSKGTQPSPRRKPAGFLCQCPSNRLSSSAAAIYLDAVAVHLDLAPADGFVWSCTRVTSVKLVGCVDDYGTFCSVAHETSVGDMMLDNASS